MNASRVYHRVEKMVRVNHAGEQATILMYAGRNLTTGRKSRLRIKVNTTYVQH